MGPGCIEKCVSLSLLTQPGIHCIQYMMGQLSLQGYSEWIPAIGMKKNNFSASLKFEASKTIVKGAESKGFNKRQKLQNTVSCLNYYQSTGF